MPSTTWTKPFLLQIGRLNSAGRILDHDIKNFFRVSLDFKNGGPHNIRSGFCIQRTKHKSLMERRLQEYIDTIFGEFAIFGDGQRIPVVRSGCPEAVLADAERPDLIFKCRRRNTQTCGSARRPCDATPTLRERGFDDSPFVVSNLLGKRPRRALKMRSFR